MNATAATVVSMGDEADLARFGADVETTTRALLKRGGAGCWGESKVFIHYVAAAMGVTDLQTFKDFLVVAQQRGHVFMSRADLVCEMNPADVAASHTEDRGAHWNFVRIYN